MTIGLDTRYRFPDRWKDANRYGNLLPSKAERQYAFSWLHYLRNGGEGLEPERGRLTIKRAQEIKCAIGDFRLWGGTSLTHQAVRHRRGTASMEHTKLIEALERALAVIESIPEHAADYAGDRAAIRAALQQARGEE